MNNAGLFTPQASPELRAQFPTVKSHDPNEDRIRLTLSRDDMWKIGRGPDWSAVVTDVPTGRIFLVEGADCGAGCYCAARIISELTDVPRSDWPRLRLARMH